jgi:hypothetical protein
LELPATSLIAPLLLAIPLSRPRGLETHSQKPGAQTAPQASATP